MLPAYLFIMWPSAWLMWSIGIYKQYSTTPANSQEEITLWVEMEYRLFC